MNWFKKKSKEDKTEKQILETVNPKPEFSQLVKDLAATGYLAEKGLSLEEGEKKLRDHPEIINNVKEYVTVFNRVNSRRTDLGITEEEFNTLLQIPNADVRHKVTEYLVKIHAGGTHKYSEKGYSLDYLLKHPDKLIEIADNPELDKELDKNKDSPV